MNETRKKRNPGRLSLPGFCFVGEARRPSDGQVEEHSGGERGIVHLAHAGEEVVSDFHDGCHYLAGAKALQGVVAFGRARRGASETQVPALRAISMARR
jgi:hypothetical protein